GLTGTRSLRLGDPGSYVWAISNVVANPSIATRLQPAWYGHSPGHCVTHRLIITIRRLPRIGSNNTPPSRRLVTAQSALTLSVIQYAGSMHLSVTYPMR